MGQVLFLFFFFKKLSISFLLRMTFFFSSSLLLSLSNLFCLPRQKGSFFSLFFLYSNALSLTQSFYVYDVFMCLSIAKQYFVHTAEPLCVSVDDEDGDPTVCMFSFSTHSSFFPSISRQGYCNSFLFLSLYVICLCVCVCAVHNHHHYQSEDNNKSHF